MRALVFNCPCGAMVCPPNKTALALIEAAGACHKCRLTKTVKHLAEDPLGLSGMTRLELLTDVLRFTEGYEGFRFHPEGR